MKKTYRYKNGTIYVTLPESCDREKLKKATEEFLRKASSGGTKHGDSNQAKHFRKEQILHR